MDLKHVAIIMDGNGRWASRRNLDAIEGHKEGVKSAEKCVDFAIKQSIQIITLYAFSFENWGREKSWVFSLLNLLKYLLTKDLLKLKEKNIKLKIIGDRSTFSKDMINLFNKVEDETKDNSAITLQLALGYSGRNEIMRSVKNLILKDRSENLDLDSLTDLNLDTYGVADPDLLIRTAGEKRISNFLLWQIAYSELYFSNTLWPDFGEKDFEEAISEYKNRKRTYGL